MIQEPDGREHPRSDRAEPEKSRAGPFDAGPYSHLEHRLHLPPPGARGSTWRRALAVLAVGWAPLLVLSALQGLELTSGRRASFLFDLPAQARYLVAAPALILAERWCLPRLSIIVGRFTRARLVVGEDTARLEALIATARRLLDRRGLEVALAAVAYLVAVVTGGLFYPHQESSWISSAAGFAPGGLSLAGWWRLLVSQPLFVLLVLGWLWRLGVWTRFLWGVARLRLRLVPAHPDQRGGLGFLCGSFSAFSPIGFATGAVMAGDLAQAIVTLGRPPGTSSQLTLVSTTAAVMIAFIAAPLLPFVVPMRKARLQGGARYSALALGLGRRFEERWMGHGRAVSLEALEANDFSATTDLYSIVANALRMNRLPFGLKDFGPLVVMTVLPFAPTALLVVSAQDVVKRIAGFFL